MDNQNKSSGGIRTLGHVVGQSAYKQQPEVKSNENPSSNFATYVAVFTLNLTNRYPDLTYLDSISVDEITRIAEFSAACTPILTQTWARVYEDKVRSAA